MRINADFLEVAQQVDQTTTRELARRMLSEFTMYTMPAYSMQPFHQLICSTLDMVRAGDLKRLMLSMPPRHGKSELVSVRLPLLALGERPDMNLIHASHSTTLSNKFSFEVRDIVKANALYRQLFPHVRLHPDRQRVDYWLTTSGGGMFSVGVQSAISGHGADAFIIDDPLKEGDEQSPATMDSIFTWYVSAANTRLSPGAWVVITATRWSPLDLIGRLQTLMKEDAKADQWYILVLPAIAQRDDVLGREVGQVLWPARFTLERLRAIRAASERYFLALFQQNPRASDAQMFYPHYFKQVKFEMPTDDKSVLCFDLAITEKDKSDYTAFARFRYNRALKILHISKIFRVRREWPAVKRMIKRLAAAFPDDHLAFGKHLLELMAIQELREVIPDAVDRIVEVEQPGDKRARAAVFADWSEAGRVYVQIGKFTQRFIDQHLNFPDEYDDWVDVTSVATHYFHLHKEFSALVLESESKPDSFADDVSATRQRISGL